MQATSTHKSLYFEYRVYPFNRPPELDGHRGRHKIVIVGGGPVGLALALELSQYGIKSTVLQGSSTESEGSRAACISRRSMEILGNLGIGEAFEAIALPWTSGTSYYRSTPIYRLEMPHSSDERYYPMANIQQNILERLMIERVTDCELIDLRWQSSLTEIEVDDTGAALSVTTPEGDYTLEADFVVAADGARSTVRKAMNLKLAGETHSAQYLIADIQLQSESGTERRAWFDSAVNNGSTILMHRQPHNIWRVDYQLRPEDDTEAEMQTDHVKKRVQQVLDMAGETGSWELDWVSLYRAHSLCLDKYVHGRVCFIGDAAHLVPIFGVKGLNSGLADANNLGWKLAKVVRRESGPNLLESYGAERRAATLEILREAGKSTRYMSPPTRGHQLMRSATLSLSLTEGWAGILANPRQSTAYVYSRSELNSWPELDGAFTAGPRVGQSAASARLGNGFLHEHFDHRAVALYFSGRAKDAEAFSELAAIAESDPLVQVVVVGVPTATPPGTATCIKHPSTQLFAAYGAKPGSLYLLRPDWHVAARSLEFPGKQKIEQAIARMWGENG